MSKSRKESVNTFFFFWGGGGVYSEWSKFSWKKAYPYSSGTDIVRIHVQDVSLSRNQHLLHMSSSTLNDSLNQDIFFTGVFIL